MMSTFLLSLVLFLTAAFGGLDFPAFFFFFFFSCADFAVSPVSKWVPHWTQKTALDSTVAPHLGQANPPEGAASAASSGASMGISSPVPGCTTWPSPAGCRSSRDRPCALGGSVAGSGRGRVSGSTMEDSEEVPDGFTSEIGVPAHCSSVTSSSSNSPSPSSCGMVSGSGGGGTGTTTSAPQAGHFPFLPASLSSTFSCLPQRHVKLIGIALFGDDFFPAGRRRVSHCTRTERKRSGAGRNALSG